MPGDVVKPLDAKQFSFSELPRGMGSDTQGKDLQRDIALALGVFEQYGRAMDPPKKPLSDTFDAKSPEGKLKLTIEKLEQSKYKPPLHCRIVTLENGQKVSVVVQSKPSVEGDLKPFPFDFKKSLQIRLLHRARTAMQMIPDSEKNQQLGRLTERWLTDWDQNATIKGLEEKVKVLEDDIVTTEQGISDIQTAVQNFKEQIDRLQKQTSALEPECSMLEAKLKKSNTSDQNEDKLTPQEKRKLIALRHAINTNKQRLTMLSQDLLKMRSQEDNLPLMKRMLKGYKKELRTHQKVLQVANQKAFEQCVDKVTLFTAKSCSSNDLNQTVTAMDKLEPFQTMKDDRMATVCLTRDENGEMHVQMEEPYRHITDEQREEFYRIGTESEPDWFKALLPAQKEMLGDIVRRSKEAKEIRGPDPLENAIPSTLRSIPGSANFSACTSLSLVADTGVGLAREGEPVYKAVNLYHTDRAATALPVDMDEHGDRQKIANQNIAQLAETLAIPKAKEYMKFWGISEGSEEKPVQVPLSISSLLSAAGIVDSSGASKKDNNTEMLLANEAAIRALEKEYAQPRLIKPDPDPDPDSKKKKPQYVQFVLLGQNYPLSEVRQIAGIRSNPKEIEEKKYDEALIKNFISHLGRIAGADFSDVSTHMGRMSRELDLIRDIKEMDVDGFNRLKEASDSLMKNPKLVEDYFISRMQKQQKGTELSLVQKKQALQQAEDFRASAAALTQLIALRREGDQAIKATAHRNRQLFMASYSGLIVGKMHGINVSGCKSSNDRRGLERAHTEAMRRIFKRHGWLPAYNDSPDKRKVFLAELVKVMKEGVMSQAVASSTPGAAGMKNNQRIKPRKVFGKWVISGMQLWPRDLQEALKKEGFVDSNHYLCKLNRIGKKLNIFRKGFFNARSVTNTIEERQKALKADIAKDTAAVEDDRRPSSHLGWQRPRSLSQAERISPLLAERVEGQSADSDKVAVPRLGS